MAALSWPTDSNTDDVGPSWGRSPRGGKAANTQGDHLVLSASQRTPASLRKDFARSSATLTDNAPCPLF